MTAPARGPIGLRRLRRLVAGLGGPRAGGPPADPANAGTPNPRLGFPGGNAGFLWRGLCAADGGPAAVVEQAQDGVRVTLQAKSTLDDGTVVGASSEAKPLVFELGAGEVMPGLESGVKGMKVGENKVIRMAAAEAYGEHDEGLVVAVAVNQLPEGTKEGAVLYSQDEQGQEQRGVVTKIDQGTASIDMNHPLAGKPVTFAVTLLAMELAPQVEVETLQPGDGKTFPAPGDRVTLHYTGTLRASGEEFDSSRARGRALEVRVGTGQAIEGWDKALPRLSLGERAKLTVPASLAYGAEGAGSSIPPNADLVFDVELLTVGEEDPDAS